MLLPPQADVPVCEDKGKEMRMLLKRLRYLLAVALAVGIVVVGGGRALAEPQSPRVELPNVVTNAHVTTSTGTTPVNVGPWQAFKIHFHYVLPNLTVHEGDTTTIELPAGFRSAAPTDFVIKDGDHIIARGKTDPTNTKYILTYTDYVEGKSDISGDFSVNAQIDSDVHTQSGVLPVNPVVSGETVPAGSVNYTVHVETALPIIKSGWANAFDTTKGVWQIKINQDGKEYTDAVLDDTLLTLSLIHI